MKNSGKETKRDRLFNFRPLFFAAFFLCFGIVYAYLHTLRGLSARWLFCLLPPTATPLFFSASRKDLGKRTLAVCTMAGCFFLGAAFFTAQLREFGDCGKYDGEYVVVGSIAEKQSYGESVRLVLDGLNIDGKSEGGRMIAYLPSSFCEGLRLSDEVLLQGTVRTDTEYFDEYGFRAEQVGSNTRFILEDAQSCVRVGHTFDLFAAVRERLNLVVCAGMGETSAAVTTAVLTGDTSGIEDGLLENIRAGGIAHIFAVSGLHVGALYAFCLLLFSKTPLKRVGKAIRFLCLTLILLLYAGVCGFTSSVVRATVICLLSYAAKLLATRSDPLESLGAAALVVLLVCPSSLFELGFRLSFAACLGIAFLSRPIGQACAHALERLVGLFVSTREGTEDARPPAIGERIGRSVCSFLSVTLAAQIATAPVLLNAFGYLSGWALLLNGLFVPLIGGAFAFLLLLAAVACALPVAVSGVVLYVPSVLWSAVLLLFEVADFSAFAITGVRFSWQACVCYYAGGSFLSDKWNLRRDRRRAFAVCFYLACAVILFFA